MQDLTITRKERNNLIRRVRPILIIAQEYIWSHHHKDGCRKARENWKTCNCGKWGTLYKIEDILEYLDSILQRGLIAKGDNQWINIK